MLISYRNKSTLIILEKLYLIQSSGNIDYLDVKLTIPNRYQYCKKLIILEYINDVF